MILKVGDPCFPAKLQDGRFIAKMEHIWFAAERYAKRHGYQYNSTYGVVGVAPT